MTLFEAIQQLYPEARSGYDFEIRDDGSGAYLAVWRLPTPRPSRAILAAMGVTEGKRTMSAVREWADLNRKLLEQAQDIIDATARPTRLGQANDIPSLIAATPVGEEVGDSGWTKERAQAVNAMWGSFGVWLSTPLEGVGLTPLQVLSMRD
jgi:hypothetical protein